MYVYIFFFNYGFVIRLEYKPFRRGWRVYVHVDELSSLPPIPLQIMVEHRDEVRGVFCIKYCDLIKTQNFFTLSEAVGDHEGREMSTMTHNVF